MKPELENLKQQVMEEYQANKAKGAWTSYLADQVKEHLLKFRPKEAAMLQAAGVLDQQALNLQERYLKQMAELTEQGMEELQAMEIAREHLYPASEDDEAEERLIALAEQQDAKEEMAANFLDYLQKDQATSAPKN